MTIVVRLSAPGQQTPWSVIRLYVAYGSMRVGMGLNIWREMDVCTQIATMQTYRADRQLQNDLRNVEQKKQAASHERGSSHCEVDGSTHMK